MNQIQAVLVALAAIGVSWLLTAWFLKMAVTRGLLDVPNARSSHTVPTPRGGGAAMAATVLVALPVLGWLHVMQWHVVAGLFTAGAIAAAVGFIDDIGYTVELIPRLAAHFAAAACVVLAIGLQPIADILQLPSSMAWLLTSIGLLYLVWMLNLTNFMDGIDGLATLEVVTVCTGGVLCALLSGYRFAAPVMGPLLVGAAAAGFLVWNWPPARIFMGDVGSGFLGISLGALSLIAGTESTPLFWSWTILSGVFVVDATTTLLRRIAHGEQFYRAHRNHAFQHAALKWGHRSVTITTGALNVVWLLPWAIGTALGWINGFAAVVIAYAPLFIVAFLLRAGVPDRVTSAMSVTPEGARNI